jgi:hypothetical protein
MLQLGDKFEDVRRLWISDWSRNATALLQASLTAAKVSNWPLRWAAWRLSNNVNEDRSRKANKLISMANGAAAGFSGRLGIRTFDYLQDFSATRDGVNPTKDAGIETMSRVLREVAACRVLPEGQESNEPEPAIESWRFADKLPIEERLEGDFGRSLDPDGEYAE